MKLSSLVYCGVGIISLFDAVLGAPISCPDIGANPVEINGKIDFYECSTLLMYRPTVLFDKFPGNSYS